MSGMELRRQWLAFMVTLVLFSLLARPSVAATLAVGDTVGWTNFDSATQRVPDYSTWTKSKSVSPGDSVVFKYVQGFHNVALLPSKADFDSCNFAKAKLLDDGTSGTFTWKASAAGIYYFACGISVEGQGTHCDAGQKVAISVGSSLAQSPALAPAPAHPVQAPSPLVPPTGSPAPAAQVPSSGTTTSPTPAEVPVAAGSVPAAGSAPVSNANDTSDALGVRPGLWWASLGVVGAFVVF